MTEFLFRDDSYLQSTPAVVTGLTAEGGIVLDRTVLYAASGGQPGDSGQIERADGSLVVIADTIHPDGDKTQIVHVPPDGSAALAVGEQVVVRVDWERRYQLMRMHTALHLLSVVFPFAVTGGSVGEGKGRLDFAMPEVPEDLGVLEERLNAMVSEAHVVSQEWITDAEMAANPDLIKTMNVKPPMGQGRVRLIRIGSVDLQPCGGTHVCNTSEIGRLALGKIENNIRRIKEVGLKVHMQLLSNDEGVDGFSWQPEELVAVREEMDQMLASYPETVISSKYYHRIITTGRMCDRSFGWMECPSVTDHLDQRAPRPKRLANFIRWASDLKTMHRCCTSETRDCSTCKDGAAHMSWVMVNKRAHLASTRDLQNWIEVYEMFAKLYKFLPW